MISQSTGKMTTLGFNGNEVEHAAVTRAAQKLRLENAAWCRRVLMKAAAEELGVRSAAVLDRDSPAFGQGLVPLTAEEWALLNRRHWPRGAGLRAGASAPAAPGKARAGIEQRVRTAQAEGDRMQAAADAKRAATAKLEAALAELDSLDAVGDSEAPKPRRRR